MVKLNWTKIKNEYINGNISYAKLAKKHKVSLQAIKDRGTREKWVAQKKEQQTKIQQITNQKTAEKIAEKESDLAANINAAAEELLAKIRLATQQLDMCLVKEKRKYTRQVKDKNTGKTLYVDIEEERTKKEKPSNDTAGRINKAELKQLSSALKDLQTIQMLGKEGMGDQSQTITFVEDLEPDE